MSRKFLNYLVALFFIEILISSSSDSIFDIAYSNRNLSLGGGSVSSRNIGAIFNAPYIPNGSSDSENFYFSYNKNNKNSLDVFYCAFNIYTSSKHNVSYGLVHRQISNNYNTDNSWVDNGDGIPSLIEIDYNNIGIFNDQETGFILSYNRKINNTENNLTLNSKAILHNILDYSAFGLSFDIKYLHKINNFNIVIGLDDFNSYKSWNNSNIEKFKSTGYISSELFLSKHFIFESALYVFGINDNNEVNCGLEYNIKNKFFTRLGYNKLYHAIGFGLNSKLVKIDYTYVKYINNHFGNSYNISFLFNINDFI